MESFRKCTLLKVDGRQNVLAHTICFSFVTLGYGDMIPISGPARALAVTEAIVGQMYLVVVVERLVSLYKRGAYREIVSTPISHHNQDPVKTNKLG